MASATTVRLGRMTAATPVPSSARASPYATSMTSSRVRASPVTITVRMADSLPSPGQCCDAPSWLRMSAVRAGAGPDPQVRALALAAEQDEELHRFRVRGAEPVRHPGVELGCLAGHQHQVLVAEHQT